MEEPIYVTSPRPSRGRIRRHRCGKCVYCLREDCGKCKNCLKKTKFGGNGMCKNACVRRQCQSMISYVVGKKPPVIADAATPAASTKSTETETEPEAEEVTRDNNENSKQKTNTTTTSSFHSNTASVRKFIYGKPVLRNPGVCSRCNGARDKEAAEEDILLCDGKGCNREFHIGCLDPPLEEVPEGDYYCGDCHALGTTSDLIKYFEDYQDDRASFVCSHDYVIHHIFNLMELYPDEIDEEEQETNTTAGEGKKRKSRSSTSPSQSVSPAGKSKKKEKKSLDQNTATKTELIPPESEIRKIKEFHSVALGDHPEEKELSYEDYPSGPEFLIGKPIRLYCPVGNSYHIGRIIDWRHASNLLPAFHDDATTIITNSNSKNKQLFYGEDDIASTEFLVRFLPGLNGRKTLHFQWMILEEHSLAVGTSIIWGEIGSFRGMQGWKPAQLLMRTSLELVPIVNEAEKIKRETNFDKKKDKEAFTMFFGGEFFALLKIRKEAADFFSPKFHAQLNISSIPTSPDNANATIDNDKNTPIKNSKNLDVIYAMGMARMEIEEQRRVKYWHKLPLQNAIHTKALTLIDESSLPELKLPHNLIPENTETSDATILPKLCPLISLGLDRVWLAETIGNTEESLDCFNSFVVKPITSMQSAIAQLHAEGS